MMKLNNRRLSQLKPCRLPGHPIGGETSHATDVISYAADTSECSAGSARSKRLSPALSSSGPFCGGRFLNAARLSCPRPSGALRASRHRPLNSTDFAGDLERVAGIEPARSAWEADRLPLHHTRAGTWLALRMCGGNRQYSRQIRMRLVRSCCLAIRALNAPRCRLDMRRESSSSVFSCPHAWQRVG